MNREKFQILSSSDRRLSRHSLLKSVLNKVRIVAICLLASSSGCATVSGVNVSGHTTISSTRTKNQHNKPVKIKSTKPQKPKTNKDEKKNEKKKDSDRPSGGKGWHPQEDIPCDELELSEPGACVQV